MFEKEAEEYGNEYLDCLVDSDDREMLQEAYKDGAEFGYELGKNECHCIKDGDLPKENQDLKKQIEELKAKIEKMADCSNCKHWNYSTRLLAYVCDCSGKMSDSIDSRTYEHCDKWELE